MSDGCSTSRFGPNMAAPLSPNCTSLSAMMRLSTLRNSIPLNSSMSISRRRVEVIKQRFDEFLRHVTQEKRAVAKVHADDAERFLLSRRFLVEQAYVHNDLPGLIA